MRSEIRISGFVTELFLPIRHLNFSLNLRVFLRILKYSSYSVSFMIEFNLKLYHSKCSIVFHK